MSARYAVRDPRSMRGAHGKAPTPLQVAAYEALMLTGSQIAAARHLGIDQGSVRSRLLGYCKRTGTDFETLPRGFGSAAEIGKINNDFAAIRVRLIEAEATRDRLQEQLDELRPLVDWLRRIEAKLDQLLARPVAVAFQPSHRRKVDGGMGGKAEVRGARRSAA